MNASPPAGFPLRLDWRPSRWQTAALAALAVAIQLALWLTDLPGLWHGVSAAIAGLWSGHLLVSHARSLRGRLVWPAPDAPAHWHGADGAERAVTVLSISVRGPLTVIRLSADNRVCARLWCPDTLTTAERRSLILARSAQQQSALLPLVAG
jgi:toxin CptA